MKPAWYLLPLIFAILLCACSKTEQEGSEASLFEARTAFGQGKYLESERLYEDYLQKQPAGKARLEAWTRLSGIAESVRNDPEAAASLIEMAMLEFPADKRKEAEHLLISAAFLYENLQQWDKAVEINQRILAIKAHDPLEAGQARQRLARAQQALGQFDLAQEALLVCLENSRDSQIKRSCQLSLARNAALTSDENQSAGILKKILDDPELPDETRAIATFNLADILEKEGDKAGSRKLFESILDLYPNRPAVEARLYD